MGGTKDVDVDAVAALGPQVVIANTEENRVEDIEALERRGIDVRVTFPKSVADVPGLVSEIAAIVDADATELLDDLTSALQHAEQARPRTPVAALTLVWRRPWMGLGPDTYADDLLRTCGFANVLAGSDDRYPRLEVGLHLGPQVVLLPSEPYAFTADDADAVRELAGDAPQHLVDGQLLTWHGARTPDALRRFSDLAAQIAAA